MGWFLKDPPDFQEHNEEVRAMWKAFDEGRPTRVPVSLANSITNLIQNPELNDTGYTFTDFFTDPEAQIQCQLAHRYWMRHHLLSDLEMGLPEEGWQLGVNFQNSYDAGWFGCPVRTDGNNVPDTVEILKENKHKLYEMECPDPLRGNLMGRAMEFYEYMHDRCRDLEFHGRPVRPPRTLPGEGSDGPLDAAYKLRGAAEICMDMLTDPDYYHDLMTFITDCLIRRMKAVREWRWEQYPDSKDVGQFRQSNWFFGDDATVMLSLEQYQEFVFPYHKRMVDEFSDGGPTYVHMCGDHARFFPFLRDHLHVRTFDTGFPIDHGALRRALGPECQIHGGPTVMQVKAGPPEAIRDAVREICASGVMEGGRFIMIAANNLAPRTPIEHVVALYEATKEFGKYLA